MIQLVASSSRTPKTPIKPWGLSFQNWFILLGVTMLLASCTNSKVLLKPLYNQLDNQLDRTVLSLVDLDNKQKRELEELTDAFHTWHRHSELPQYSAFLETLANQVEAPEETNNASFTENLILTTRQFRETAFACHPANFAAGLLKSLSYSQIDQMKASYFEQQQKRRKQIKKLSEAKRIDKATKNAKKWMARANLKLDNKQSDLLRVTIAKQMRPGQQFIDELDSWSNEFFDLLKQSDAPAFDQRFGEAVKHRWELFGSANPEVVQANRSLWLNYTQDLISSMSAKQRNRFSKWLRKMSNTLYDISQEKKTNEATDTKKGCVANHATQPSVLFS